MVLRGEQILRCGPGRCTPLSRHTLIKHIADLHPDSVRTLPWSDLRAPICLSLPELVSCRLIVDPHCTLTTDQLSLE